jgi:diacylglycerol kinase
MFERWTYVGTTVLFCVPPLILLWLRREFFEILRPRLPRIALAAAVLTVYGGALWPIALRWGAWAYRDDRITGIEILGYVWLDDVIWWYLVGFLMASFIALSIEYERRGVDIVLREIRGLFRSFRAALGGFRVVPLERNTTIHIAVASLVLMEGVLFGISAVEWMLVAGAVGAVLGAEILNSAIERLASRAAGSDVARPPGTAGSSATGYDPEIGLIKDVAAAGVLVTAAAAASIGCLIFLKRIVTALS